MIRYCACAVNYNSTNHMITFTRVLVQPVIVMYV